LFIFASSCGGEQKPGVNQDNAPALADGGARTDESENAAREEEVKLLPDLPGDLDFGGYQFRALYSSVDEAGVWGLRDIVSEEINGEVINDAVFMRNQYLEGKYNFEIIGIPTTSSTMQSSSMRRIIQAGTDAYDVMFARMNQTGDLITSGSLVDLNTVLYLDFDKPWWDKSIIDQLSIGGRRFAAAGDIMATNSNAFRVFLFNKQMIADFGLDDPYRLVRENQWTLDKFYDMSRDISRDLNGDGIMDQHDQYGYLVQSTSSIKLFYSAGEHMVIKDGGDMPSLTRGNERTLQVLDTINSILSRQDSVMFDQDFTGLDPRGPEYVLMTTFEDGRGLFFSEVLQLAERMRATDTDFGILPPPKFDERQPEYIVFSDSFCMNLMLIPATNTDINRTGAIIEAMAAESRYGLLPAYYDKTLRGKYTRDDESEEMLDIIIKNRVISLDNVFGWGLHDDIRNALARRSGDFVSVYERSMDRALTRMQRTIDAIESLE
jgi:hypothetical protein